ncbi:unnamed protein product [Mytilus coruscus]|uniref:Caffeoyl-CoA O-methyltransferase n=1 Tax=Mytilus coruscus TaxID=42192 RepID=A0A6J8EJW6_MYTCO|nr:unnamed protein product [Mytilus coruscus]
MSAILYVLAAEPLGQALLKNNNIHGIKIPFSVKESKYFAHADDTALTVADKNLVTEAFKIFDLYSQASGEKINREKSEILCLGSKISEKELEQFGIKPCENVTKLLGIYIGKDKQLCESLNWDEKIKKIKNNFIFNFGSKKELTLPGRATVFSTLTNNKLSTEEKGKMSKRSRDPAINKLREVKAEAESLGVPESIINGMQAVDDLAKAREDYCDNKTSTPSESMAALIKDTLEHPWQNVYEEGKTTWNISPRMMSGNLEGYVLKFLVSASKSKNVLEVGMFTGCSALGMAEVMPDDGKVVTCELDPYLVDLARKFMDRSPHGKKVEILTGPAIESLNGLAKKNEKFDFIFIDADKAGYCDYFNNGHMYASVFINVYQFKYFTSYLHLCTITLVTILLPYHSSNNSRTFDYILRYASQELLAPGGTIAMDNALFGGKPYMEDRPPNEGVTKFNNMIVTRKDIYYVLMPVRDGIMLIRRKEDMNGTV